MEETIAVQTENSTTEGNIIDLNKALIKKESQKLTNFIETNKAINKAMLHEAISSEYRKKLKSRNTDDNADNCENKVAVREPMIYVSRMKEEPYDTFNFVDVKNEPSTTNLCFYCEECDIDSDEFCIKCPMLLHILHNSTVNTMEEGANKTIPKNILEIRESLDHFQVFAIKTIPKNIIFGPFYGLTSVQTTAGCAWKIKNGKLVCSENENDTNWMRYIESTEDAALKNLIVFQHDGNLYYQSDREIENGEELLVYYREDLSYDLNDAETYHHPDVEREIGNVYGCTFCCLGFSSEVHLMKHKIKCSHARNNDGVVAEITQCPFCKIYLDEREHSAHHANYCREKHARTRVRQDDVARSKEIANGKGEKKFVCPKCAYETSVKSRLNRHSLTHESVKPFRCQMCNKRFSERSSLKRHFGIHFQQRQSQLLRLS